MLRTGSPRQDALHSEQSLRMDPLKAASPKVLSCCSLHKELATVSCPKGSECFSIPQVPKWNTQFGTGILSRLRLSLKIELAFGNGTLSVALMLPDPGRPWPGSLVMRTGSPRQQGFVLRTVSPSQGISVLRTGSSRQEAMYSEPSLLMDLLKATSPKALSSCSLHKELATVS